MRRPIRNASKLTSIRDVADGLDNRFPLALGAARLSCKLHAGGSRGARGHGAALPAAAAEAGGDCRRKRRPDARWRVRIGRRRMRTMRSWSTCAEMFRYRMHRRSTNRRGNGTKAGSCARTGQWRRCRGDGRSGLSCISRTAHTRGSAPPRIAPCGRARPIASAMRNAGEHFIASRTAQWRGRL